MIQRTKLLAMDERLQEAEMEIPSVPIARENLCTKARTQIIAEMMEVKLPQHVFTHQVCEKLVQANEVESLEAGVSAATPCRVRHADFGTEWGLQGDLKLVSGGEPIIRWQYDSRRAGFPLMYMFAVETRWGLRYVLCDQQRQRIRLRPGRNLPDPSSINVDFDTSDPRLFVFDVPATLGGEQGFLHPRYTWRNPTESLLSVAEENGQIVLADHHSGSDRWLMEDA